MREVPFEILVDFDSYRLRVDVTYTPGTSRTWSDPGDPPDMDVGDVDICQEGEKSWFEHTPTSAELDAIMDKAWDNIPADQRTA